ncbi:DUF6587 family protein [Collimonas pratensis]|uniref:Lipoprotein n=1 Tax=Collimonas pratensis TaxID=279113 RepID=A0A127Q8G3_9BURK|nr:DUF6587 family protein [Collimonas pratensis]AMP06314.1 putative lipoprotein [Collimonas pratensis]AMP16233.1 putative lipoprotein [Collimonas pratensis]NKI70569.1 hypothetical protein [Collimonas pratensis]
MTPFLIVQALVIGLAVIASLLYACRRLMPATSQRLQANLADALSQSSRPALLRKLGGQLQPTAAAGGCGSGCGSCSTGCGTSAPTVEEQPVKFRERPGE